MILKAEPDKILRFVRDNFSTLSALYRVQLRDGSISQDDFEGLTRFHADIIKKRLFDYKLLSEQYGDYRLTEAVRQFLGFLLNEFKPLLPAQLRRYKTSLEDLFTLLQGTAQDKSDVMEERQEHLYDEILSFLDNVAGNTNQLLRKTQRLKRNKQQLNYPDRIRKARHLIEHYIAPLNQILDHRNPESITSLLWRMNQRVNLEKLSAHAPGVQSRYAQLDDLLRSTNDHLLRQSRIITRELLPLLERLKRESEVLNGWLYFLESPFLRPIPDFAKSVRYPAFSDQTETEVRFFFEQFVHRQEQISLAVGQEENLDKPAFFNAQFYQNQLQEALPITNYFSWCATTMNQYEEVVDPDHFIQLCSLVFDETEEYTLEFSSEKTTLQLGAQHYWAPVIKVEKK